MEDREKKKKKKISTIKETIVNKQIDKKLSSSEKSEPDKKKKKKKSINGVIVKEPRDIVIPSSSTDSQEEDKAEQQQGNGKTTRQCIKSPNPKKRSKNERGGDDGDGDGDGEEIKMCRFHMKRIKRIMKSKDPDSQITHDAVFLVNKATEMFLENFSEDAYECSVKDRKKFIHYKHLSSVVGKGSRYEFLSDFVPEKLKAEDEPFRQSTLCSAHSMTSSKKSKEEKEKRKKKKSSSIIKETKPTKQIDKKPSSSKKSEPDKKKKSSNGSIIKEPQVIVIPSSSTDSQEEDKEEQQRGDGETTRQRTMSLNPKKRSKKKRGDDDGDRDGEEIKTCRFPMNRIKRIMKSEDPDSQITQDAVFLVNKAMEMFLEQFSEDAYECSVLDRKKFIHYKHLSSVVGKGYRYEFLSDFVPEKLKAEEALAQWELAEMGQG